MHLSHPVQNTGIEEYSLGRRRLAGINVGHDADIAIALDGGFTRHESVLETYQR
jgi:hypothetical protein